KTGGKKTEMKMNRRKFTGAASVFVLAAIFLALRLTAGPAIDPDADRIFRASCKYLAEAKAFCVKVEVWKDVVLPTGEKLQTTRTLEVGSRGPTSFASRCGLRAIAAGSGIRKRRSRCWIAA